MGRLAGWGLNPSTHELKELPRGEVRPPELWSAELQSRLVVAGRKLFLYDEAGKLRLNRAETEYERAETEGMRAEAERAERIRERKRAEAERMRAEKLAEFLRQHNFNPDDLV